MTFSYLLNLEDDFDYFDYANKSDDRMLIISVLILSVSITGRNIDDDDVLVVSYSDFYTLSLLNNFSLTTTIFRIITSTTAINIDYVTAFCFHLSYFI